jgi:hypothetical protein
MLKLSIQCTRFEVIIVVVQVGAVKIYAVCSSSRGGAQDKKGVKNRM